MERSLPYPAVVLAALAAGLQTGCEAEPTPSPTGDLGAFTVSEPLPCEVPTAPGLDRLAEEGAARGLIRPLSDPFVTMNPTAWGLGGHLVAEDLDGDGDTDLMFGRVDGAPDIYSNDGTGHFDLVPEAVIVDDREISQLHRVFFVLAGDLNGDGLPEILLGGDLVVVRYENLGDLRWDGPRLIWSDPGDMPLAYVTALLGDADGDLDLDLALPSVGHSGGDPGDSGPDPTRRGPDPHGEPGEPSPDRILLFHGDEVIEGPLLFTTDTGSVALVGLWTDRDGDADMDLLIPADRMLPTAFWRNEGLGPDGLPHFVDQAQALSAQLTMGAMGIDAADLNADGHLDVCISDAGPPRCLTSYGPGGYVENGVAMGIVPREPLGTLGTTGWAVEFADLDNDGWVELLQGSGPFAAGPDPPDVMDLPNLLWRGQPGPSFADVTAETGFGDVGNHPGLVTADVDGDGWLDVVVASPGRTPLLYMNRCGADHWVEVDLIGPPGNRNGYGAQVEVWAGGRVQLRQVDTLRATSQRASRVHVGLGEHSEIEEVVVRWQGGRHARLRGIPADTTVTALWSGAHPGPGVTQPPTETMALTGLVHGTPGDTPMVGVNTWASADPGTTVPTDSAGAYTLSVPRDEDTEVHAESEGRVPSIVAVDGDWQRNVDDGLQHDLFEEADLAGLYQGGFNVEPDPARGSLWVEVFGGKGGRWPLVGARVEIDAAHVGAIVVGEGASEPGDVLIEGGREILFGNVERGNVGIVVTPPAMETCVGRTLVPVEAGALTQVRVRCE